MKSINYFLSIIISILFFSSSLIAEEKVKSDEKKDKSSLYSGLKFRSIGPALMSGRISDIVIHPENENVWYVTAGSGGVWKTENSGTSWNSIFDGQKSYSIGCITLDPQNSNVVWVGTGENVGGRHVAYGDGIYKSEDGGKSWKNMGLKKSEHISKIIVHPKNNKILWVASQGPLWSSGGERGIFKTIDGGKTWTQTLGDSQWIGATDLLMDPRNPNHLYAATWQRHRTVAGYMGGGPGTGIYKSTDGGESWQELKKGLPKSNMGKIGLVLSPQNSDVIYAAIELDRRTGGVYRSDDQGANWKKMSDAMVIKDLCKIKGIGPWSAEMFLMFVFLRPDILPLGDLGLRRAVGIHYLQKHDPTYKEVEQVAEKWKPYRSAATWYLWRSIDPIPVSY